jgi:hypothetical protein
MNLDRRRDGPVGADEGCERGTGVRLDPGPRAASIESAIGSSSASRNVSTDAGRVAPVEVSKRSIRSPAPAVHCRSSSGSPAAKYEPISGVPACRVTTSAWVR